MNKPLSQLGTFCIACGSRLDPDQGLDPYAERKRLREELRRVQGEVIALEQYFETTLCQLQLELDQED